MDMDYEEDYMNCSDCDYWDKGNLKCNHPENGDPDAKAYAEDGCYWGEC